MAVDSNVRPLPETTIEFDVNAVGCGNLKLNGQDMSLFISGFDVHVAAGEITDVALHVIPDKVLGSMLVKNYRLNIDDTVNALVKGLKEKLSAQTK